MIKKIVTHFAYTFMSPSFFKSGRPRLCWRDQTYFFAHPQKKITMQWSIIVIIYSTLAKVNYSLKIFPISTKATNFTQEKRSTLSEYHNKCSLILKIQRLVAVRRDWLSNVHCINHVKRLLLFFLIYVCFLWLTVCAVFRNSRTDLFCVPGGSVL